MVSVRIVGIAQSISTPDVALWAAPELVGRLAPGGQPAQQALYRVEPSTSRSDLTAAIAAITSGLPADG